MAKTTICAFCGKELTTGFFKGTAIPLEFADCEFMDCCEQCLDRYDEIVGRYKKLFTVKLENYRKKNRRKQPPAETIAAYRRFLNQAMEREARLGDGEPTIPGAFYVCDENGTFGWVERKIGFLNEDFSTKDMCKTLKNVFDYDAFLFTKEDVSCLRYRLCNKQILGPFSEAYSVEICLNPQEDLSFRPTFGRTVVVSKGLFGLKKKARLQAQAYMEDFRAHIGCPHLPIEQVKKFK